MGDVADGVVSETGPADFGVTDDTADTVTFHLGRADPDFLYKLALLLATPTPPRAAGRAVNRAPFLPGTGPYMISQYRPDVAFTLVRNPYFRQWSYAAQPAGYPSVIRYELVPSQSKQESAVIAGRADLAQLDENDESLAIQYPARVHLGLKLNTLFVILGTRQPPFTNIMARQALNYAIDRARILQFAHLASGQATATCQILPADFPGHQSYCPYTAGTQDGGWHAPDMAKARQLVQDSRTTNVPVTIWTINDPPTKAGASYLVRLLKDLGYRAKLHAVSIDRFWTGLDNPRLKIRMGYGAGWGADFPAPSTFFGPLLSCRASYEPASANFAEFCNPHVDKLVGEAQAAQSADPTAARSLWAQADRIVTDQAPYVPVFNETSAGFVSSRAGNYQQSPEYGPLLDQMWVR
jgi:peptide/nickel transport system substrate-binding protein